MSEPGGLRSESTKNKICVPLPILSGTSTVPQLGQGFLIGTRCLNWDMTYILWGRLREEFAILKELGK